MNELPDDLIHSEYFTYRSQFDLLNEHYEDLLDDLSSFLGNPYYKLLTIGSLEGNLFFYWEGPFSKAPFMRRVELNLERVSENNSVGLLTKYIFTQPLSVDDICVKSPNIDIYKNLIESVYKAGESFVVGSVEDNYFKRIRFWISKSDSLKYESVEIIAYFEIPNRYDVTNIDFDYKIRQQVTKAAESVEQENLPDKEFFELQMKNFNHEFNDKMNTAIGNFGKENEVEIVHSRKQFTWNNAYLHDFKCIYILEISDGEEGTGYIETWVLDIPMKSSDLKNHYPMLNKSPDEIRKAPKGNKIHIYNRIEKTGATILQFLFTRDLFPKIFIITNSHYFNLPRQYTKASQN